MAIAKKLLNYLDKNKVKYEVVEHRKVFTAYDAAATMHKKLSQIAKNLLVKVDKDFIMAVLPASRNLDLKKLAKVVGAKKAELPSERVMVSKFKVKPGALPAFGGLYKLPVYVDRSLLKEKKVVFSSGDFQASIEMSVKDYLKLEQVEKGQIASFSVVKKIKKTKSKKTKRARKQVKKKTKQNKGKKTKVRMRKK